MFNRRKWLQITLAAALLAGGGSVAHVYGLSGAAGSADEGLSGQPAAPGFKDEQSFFRSNAYSRAEAAVQNVPVTAVAAGFEQIGDNSRMTLYMNKKTFAIQVRDKASGYVWSSVPGAKDLNDDQLNEDWKNAMQSPFLVSYFQDDASDSTSNYLSLHGKASGVKRIENGVELMCELPDIGVKLTVRVALDADSLLLTVPNDSIVETGKNKLASLQLYPFLGAVRGGSVPGYLFIPDGSGALIRFSNNHTQFDEPFVGQIYGSDAGVVGMDAPFNPVQYPVFGIVHGAGRNALVGFVEDGKTNAEIVAYPSGVNTSFYWAAPRFNIRYAYFQPTSKSMGGINMFTQARTEGDKQVRYRLLSGQEADYAGMAKAYRSYLRERNMLPAAAGAAAGNGGAEDVPLKLELLGGDVEPGLLKRRLVPMTSFDNARAILDDLAKDGVTNVTAVLKGWSEGGANGAVPASPKFAGSLGSKSGFADLRDYAKKRGIELYLYNDYANMVAGSPRVDPRANAVRMVTSRLVEFHWVSKFVSDLFKDMKGYLLGPKTALKLAKDDFAAYGKAGVDGVALGYTGYMLFSDYHKGDRVNRTQAADLYGQLGGEAEKRSLKLGIEMPNDYMLKYAGRYFQMPLQSSQFMFETDSVPFVPMVLHGTVDYFAANGNTNADPALDLLRMIEYGAYPSFLVTKEPSQKLMNTPSSDLFTTEYNDWAAEIKRQYKVINETLKPVRGAAMIGREVKGEGIVKVSYDNGVDIWVNYTGRDYTDGQVEVKARDAAVVTGGARG